MATAVIKIESVAGRIILELELLLPCILGSLLDSRPHPPEQAPASLLTVSTNPLQSSTKTHICSGLNYKKTNPSSSFFTSLSKLCQVEKEGKRETEQVAMVAQVGTRRLKKGPAEQKQGKEIEKQ
jgi:hypothetical protein